MDPSLFQFKSKIENKSQFTAPAPAIINNIIIPILAKLTDNFKPMRIITFFIVLFLATLCYASQNIPFNLISTPSDNPKLIYTFKPNTNKTNSHGYFDNEYAYKKENGI